MGSASAAVTAVSVQGSGRASGVARCAMTAVAVSSTAVERGHACPVRVRAEARRRRASSRSSTPAAAAGAGVARVFSTGASTGGGWRMVWPGRRWRDWAARRRRSSSHIDPARTGPPVSPATNQARVPAGVVGGLGGLRVVGAPHCGTSRCRGRRGGPGGRGGGVGAGRVIAAGRGGVVGGCPGRGRERVAPRAAGGVAWSASAVWRAGDGQSPADVDDVRVEQVGPAGLGGVRGRVEDLGVAVGVAQLCRGRSRTGCRPAARCTWPAPPPVRVPGAVRPARSGSCRGGGSGSPPRTWVLRAAICV